MARAMSRNTRRLLAGVAALSTAGVLVLLDARTEAATPLTLQTIAIDGAVGDWDAVIGNALQTTRDGDGSSPAITANCPLYSTDRDCPQGGGAGNDLHTFAWTYDASYVYLYIERYGSTANGVDFFFVADANRDKRLKATGDKAIHARWWGSTGNVTVDAGPYTPADAINGDPIVSAAGYVDGYDLPGTSGALSAITCAAGAIGQGVTVGADAGRKMELRIPWCAFGVSAGKPFYWHVVSTNNGSLSTPLDNIGAPSGGLGSFVQRAVTLTPDRSGAVLSPGEVTYDHTLVNDGNDADVVDLRATSSQGAKIEIVDAGVVIGRDDQGDGAWELTPQVSLGAGASKALQVRITMPPGRTGQDLTRVTATSSDDPTASAIVTDWSHVGSPAFVPETFSAWTRAGVAAAFAELLVNGQLAADTFDLTPGAGCAGDALLVTVDSAGAQVVARDDNGDGTWDFVNAADDTNANGLPDMGAIPGQTTRPFWLWVQPPPGAPEGSCTVQLTAASPTTAAAARADHTVTVAPAVAFTPSYTRTGGTSLRANIGGSVFFPALLRNSEDVPRAYTFTQLLSPPGSGATARVWSDPDGDGSPSDGAVITATGTIAAFGGTQAVVIELLAGSAANGASLSLATTATATIGGAAATQVSEADVSYLASYSDALHAHATSLFPPCATVYVHGSGLLPGDVTSYALTWLTPAAATARAVQPWPTNALGTADDAYALAATAPTGTWTARLVDAPGARDQGLSFTVELNGSVASLTTDKASYRPGEVVQVSGAFHDAGRVALGAGAFDYALDGVPLRTRSGVTVAAGATVSDPFVFTLPLGSAPGVRTLTAGWRLSCGADAFATRSATFEVLVPGVPGVPSIAPALPTYTNSTGLTVAGAVEAGATVSVYVDGVLAGTTTATALGTYTVDITLPAVQAAHTVEVKATDALGNDSPAVASATVTLDQTSPDAPVVGAVTSPTSADPVVIGVTAEAGATVVLVVDGLARTTLLPTTRDGDHYAFELSLADGPHTVEATVTDAAGNVNLMPSNTVSFAVDRAAAASPPPADSSGGGGCGCGAGGASTPEGLTLLAICLATFRRRRAPNPATLRAG